MDRRSRVYVATGAVVALFLLVQFGALALARPFEAANYYTVENPQDPITTLFYVGGILLATGFVLVAVWFDVDWLLRIAFVGAGAYLATFVFRAVLPSVSGTGVHVLAWLAGIALAGTLYVYPEWYVIDAAGVLMGAAAAGLFGLSLSVLPAILLLVVLSVYDAISVYGTKHMLTIASQALDLKVPIVFVVPLTLSYSYLKAEPPDPAVEDDAAGDDPAGDDGPLSDDEAGAVNGTRMTTPDGEKRLASNGEGGPTRGETGAEGPDRNALFVGLGDAIIPAILVASVGVFAPESVPSVGGIALPAVTAMAGSIAGLLVLLRMVFRGRAHAGLPLLNGGAIAGYLLGALASGLGLIEALGLGPYL